MRALAAAALLRQAASIVENNDRWNDASFFDSFHVGESTSDYDSAQVQRAEDNPFHNYVDGYNPDVTDPFDPKHVDVKWFASLPSGGSEQALQTLPEPNQGPFGHAQKTGGWYYNDGGNFVQSYEYPKKYEEQAAMQRATGGDVFHLLKGSAKKQADWFDASTAQFDAYGRPKAPYPGNPAALVSQGYKQEARNASLSCKAAGCNASAQLTLNQDSDLQNCILSVQVKPTDFSSGTIEFITVNNVTVSLNCKPPADCSKANELSSLYSCVSELHVQNLLGSDRSLVVEAKISKDVQNSDCAYQGNLLYAVPQVTCLVGTPQGGSGSQAKATPVDLPGSYLQTKRTTAELFKRKLPGTFPKQLSR
ncbi:unnamed protein product [Effrenium voratum]|nr:unnamed protein product [Effrenium voratum]